MPMGGCSIIAVRVVFCGCGCVCRKCVCAKCVCVIVGSSLAFARHWEWPSQKRASAFASQLFVLAILLALVFAGNETENIKPKPKLEMKNQYYCKLACVASRFDSIRTFQFPLSLLGRSTRHVCLPACLPATVAMR